MSWTNISAIRASLSLSTVFIYGVAFVTAWVVAHIIYNIFLHPLRSFPGPLSHRASRLPYSYRVLRGTLALDILKLHEKYGTIIRVAPNELAFADPAAWKDIMGHKSGAGASDEMGKWAGFYRPVQDIPTDIVNADREEHAWLRRQLSHGFSDRSMRDQEPLIGQYIDLLIQRLHENCEANENPINMAAWYNFTTFDIIGDLAFGEPFGCLETSSYHPWVKMIFQTARLGTILQTVSHYPMFLNLLLSMVPKSVMEDRAKHMKYTKDKVERRMNVGETRPDLIEGLLKKKNEWDMGLSKLQANSSLLIIAGSETTATLLTGLTYLLLTNPDSLSKLTSEVRSAFSEEKEIDINSVSRLKFLQACLDEALRVYPPVPIGLPRVVPPSGGSICGYYVPGNTIVAVHQWAMYHNKAHFADPFSYRPERFLGDERYADDNREALQPFSVGPRNCLGKNLAYTEMRLILARMVFNFDMKLAEESRGWLNQKVYNFWERGPLYVHLSPVIKT